MSEGLEATKGLRHDFQDLLFLVSLLKLSKHHDLMLYFQGTQINIYFKDWTNLLNFSFSSELLWSARFNYYINYYITVWNIKLKCGSAIPRNYKVLQHKISVNFSLFQISDLYKNDPLNLELCIDYWCPSEPFGSVFSPKPMTAIRHSLLQKQVCFRGSPFRYIYQTAWQTIFSKFAPSAAKMVRFMRRSRSRYSHVFSGLLGTLLKSW